MLRIAVAAITAACLAVPAVAAAEDHAHAVDHITCTDGTVLTPPFTPPVCAEHGGVASVSCVSGTTLTPPLDGKRCPATSDGSGEPQQPAGDGGDDGDETAEHGDEGHDGDGPRLKAAFLNRVWRIAGSADGFDAGVLSFTADHIVDLPHRFSKQDDALIDQDARVLVGARTRVFDADHHRLTGDAATSALDAAEDVVVLAKLLPRDKWLDDEDGAPVPTLRAKRILVKA
ncbi:MAG: hypothetical protein V7607_462 [Solirubrobacteraceae bacterium]